MCRNEIQFASWRPEKIWFLAAYPCILNQSLVSSVASHGKQDLRRKSFRFLSQCLSDFCEISVKICSPWNSGISLGKKMGKQFFLHVAPSQIGSTQYMSTLLYLVASVSKTKHDVTRPDCDAKIQCEQIG